MIEALRVKPGKPARIRERDPRDTLGIEKEDGRRQLAEVHERLALLQQRLYAEAARSVLLVLQGLDASGKDGVIRSVFTSLNPLGCRAVAFKAPTSTELAHDFLWRVHAVLPGRGEIGVFNRSHYEDVVTVRVRNLAAEQVWRRRPRHIREWERMLTDEGTTIVKVFLNVSKDEQRKRLQERIDDPEKRWKFRLEDLEVRRLFDDYIAAYEDALTETSTE
jgi:PPK2 family polyphosphate:nucleotide phosphotransferase